MKWSRNIKPVSKYSVIYEGRNRHVCVLSTGGWSPEELERNCNIIAAAPELLEAACAAGVTPEGYCFCSKNRIGDNSKIHEPECRDLRAAIAKAGVT